MIIWYIKSWISWIFIVIVSFANKICLKICQTMFWNDVWNGIWNGVWNGDWNDAWNGVWNGIWNGDWNDAWNGVWNGDWNDVWNGDWNDSLNCNLLEWAEIELLFSLLSKKSKFHRKKPKPVGKPQNTYFLTVGNEQIIQLEDFTKVNLP